VLVDFPETLVGVAELSIALAGFTGVVTAFRSANQGSWHPGDRLRLYFLLESSLTAAGFSLLTLVLLHVFANSTSTVWVTMSSLWAVFMPWSLYSSHRRIQDNLREHGDIDQFANRLTFLLFSALIAAQVANVFIWREFAPLLAALCSNLAGAAMQFARLIRSAFQD
jgi:hypothetical protein